MSLNTSRKSWRKCATPSWPSCTRVQEGCQEGCQVVSLDLVALLEEEEHPPAPPLRRSTKLEPDQTCMSLFSFLFLRLVWGLIVFIISQLSRLLWMGTINHTFMGICLIILWRQAWGSTSTLAFLVGTFSRSLHCTLFALPWNVFSYWVDFVDKMLGVAQTLKLKPK